MSAKTDILFRLGPAENHRTWPDYLAHGFTTADVPALVALAADQTLHNADPDSNDVWVPVHAWRTLGQLRAPDAARPLIALFDTLCDEDWALSELYRVLGMIGEPALDPLAAYLAEPGHEEFARIMAVDALAEVAKQHPALRDRVLSIYRDYLREPDTTASTLNGLLLSRLIDLNAVELIDDIRQLFARNCVDLSCAGDLEEVEMQLGLRTQRDTPPPDYARLLGLSPPPEATDREDIRSLVDDYLAKYGTSMSIRNSSELDGFLAALICMPEMLPPSAWLADIWGGEDLAPEWDDEDDLRAFFSAIILLYNKLSSDLDDEVYAPVFIRKTQDGRPRFIVDDWCIGFVRGLRLWPKQTGDDLAVLEECLMPIWLFTTEEGRKAQDSMGQDEAENWQQRIGPNVQRLFAHFARRVGQPATPYVRETAKVGRNDPCPCGSGKKYKRCCLH